jgi:hypothetical protein
MAVKAADFPVSDSLALPGAKKYFSQSLEPNNCRKPRRGMVTATATAMASTSAGQDGLLF